MGYVLYGTPCGAVAVPRCAHHPRARAGHRESLWARLELPFAGRPHRSTPPACWAWCSRPSVRRPRPRATGRVHLRRRPRGRRERPPGATVTLYDDFQDPSRVPRRSTGADGTFEFGGLGRHLLRRRHQGRRGHRLLRRRTVPSPTPRALRRRHFGRASTSTLMPAPPVIAGTVSNAGGPIEFADVTAYKYDATSSGPAPTRPTRMRPVTTSSPPSGSEGLPARGSAPPVRFTEYWNDKAVPGPADDVTVVAGPPGRPTPCWRTRCSSGHRDRHGWASCRERHVTAEQQVTDDGDTYWDQVDFAFTAANGTYTLEVPPGDTRIQFDAATYMTEYYDDALDEADARRWSRDRSVGRRTSTPPRGRRQDHGHGPRQPRAPPSRACRGDGVPPRRR